MNPARSLTSTASLPHAMAKAMAAAIVSSLAVIGRTTSTNDIIVAGLKKWTPQTLSGRCVTIASSTTGRVEVLVARIARRLDDLFQFGEEVLLGGEVLDHGFDDEVALGQRTEVVGGVDRPEGRLRSSSVALPLSIAFTKPLSIMVTIASAVSRCATARRPRSRRGRRLRPARRP